MTADPLGRAMYDHATGGRAGELRYRDGDEAAPHDVPSTYLTGPEGWSPDWRRQLDALEGPVLDAGCGAGKHARWLQGHDREVIAIDASPGAVASARARGVEDARRMDLFDLDFSPDRFRSAIVIGTQIGLAGSLPGIRTVLSDLATVTEPGGTAIVDSYDPRELDPNGFLGYRSDPREGVARRAFHFEYERPDGGLSVGRTLSFVLFGPIRLRDVLIGTPWALDDLRRRDAYYAATLVR